MHESAVIKQITDGDCGSVPCRSYAPGAADVVVSDRLTPSGKSHCSVFSGKKTGPGEMCRLCEHPTLNTSPPGQKKKKTTSLQSSATFVFHPPSEQRKKNTFPPYFTHKKDHQLTKPTGRCQVYRFTSRKYIKKEKPQASLIHHNR